jgi:nucleolin
LLASSPSTSSFISKPRAISSLASSLPRARPVAQSLTFQRRWATTDAAKEEEEEVPVSEIQPTLQEEVENAIHEDRMAAADDAAPAQATFQDDAASVIPPKPNRGIYAENLPKPAIYLGNLFFDLTENDLKRAFSQFGEVTHVRILRDMRGLSKG